MKYLLLVLALLIPQMVTAKIGANVEECVERYGPIINEKVLIEREVKEPDGKVYIERHFKTTHHKNGYEITCSFQGTICWKLKVRRLDEKPIKDRVIESLLKQESKDWKKVVEEIENNDVNPFIKAPKHKVSLKPKRKRVYWETPTMLAEDLPASHNYDPFEEKYIRRLLIWTKLGEEREARAHRDLAAEKLALLKNALWECKWCKQQYKGPNPPNLKPCMGQSFGGKIKESYHKFELCD